MAGQHEVQFVGVFERQFEIALGWKRAGNEELIAGLQ